MCQVPLLLINVMQRPDLDWVSRYQFTLNFSPGSISLAKPLRTLLFSYLVIYSLQQDLCFDHTSRIAGQACSQKSAWAPTICCQTLLNPFTCLPKFWKLLVSIFLCQWTLIISHETHVACHLPVVWLSHCLLLSTYFHDIIVHLGFYHVKQNPYCKC